MSQEQKVKEITLVVRQETTVRIYAPVDMSLDDIKKLADPDRILEDSAKTEVSWSASTLLDPETANERYKHTDYAVSDDRKHLVWGEETHWLLELLEE